MHAGHAGRAPYHGMRLSRVTRARDNHEPPYDMAAAADANAELQRDPGRSVLSLLGHCLAEDPEERPSMRQCVHALTPLAPQFLQQHALRIHTADQCALRPN